LLAFDSEPTRQAILGKHPNVVEFLGIATDAIDGDQSGVDTASLKASTTGRELPALVLEYVERGSVETALKAAAASSETIEVPVLVSWCRDTAAGLSNAHSAGVIHNDVAARNILVAQDGTVRSAWSSGSLIVNSR
jgi:serine/threonine protein kinase